MISIEIGKGELDRLDSSVQKMILRKLGYPLTTLVYSPMDGSKRINRALAYGSKGSPSRFAFTHSISLWKIASSVEDNRAHSLSKILKAVKVKHVRRVRANNCSTSATSLILYLLRPRRRGGEMAPVVSF
jgi:hypothetical protein